jgi:hypothetical protein
MENLMTGNDNSAVADSAEHTAPQIDAHIEPNGSASQHITAQTPA